MLFLLRAFTSFDIAVAATGVVLVISGALLQVMISIKQMSFIAARLAFYDISRKNLESQVGNLETLVIKGFDGLSGSRQPAADSIRG